jgi:hypothetical protein
LNGAARSFFIFCQSENDHAFQVFELSFDDFESVHDPVELIAFKLERFAHRSWKLFGGFSRSRELLLGFSCILESDAGKFGQGFHIMLKALSTSCASLQSSSPKHKGPLRRLSERPSEALWLWLRFTGFYK